MKILIIDSIHEILLEKLSENGFQYDYLPSIQPTDIDSLNHSIYNGIVLRSKIVLDAQIIDKFKNLRFIGRVGAGMENIDTEYAKVKNISCISSPEGNSDAVGEHAIGMLLSLFNHLSKANNEVKNGIWKREENRGIEILGKTIGIIGYGNTGKAFADKLKGFGAKILAYDKYKTQFGDKNIHEVSLDELKVESDIISFHVPLTLETKYYFNEDFIQETNKPFYLINTSRGSVVKTSALVSGIKNNKVLGACLDVHEYEDHSFENFFNQDMPSDFKYLTQSERVILSPHVAGWTRESKIKLALILAEKIINEFKSDVRKN